MYRALAVLELALLAVMVLCGAKPAPVPVPPPPSAYVCNPKGIMVITQIAVDAQGSPITGPIMALDTHICTCSDGVVRYGAWCSAIAGPSL